MAPCAVLFDLDDTLADRAAGFRRYAQKLREDFLLDLAEITADAFHAILAAVDDFGSMGQAEALARHQVWKTPPAPSRLFQHWNTYFGLMAVPFDGVLDLLTYLRDHNIKLGMITNGSSEMQRRKLAALGVEAMLDSMIISSEVGFKKPDQRIFKLALDDLGCHPGEAWFVGDHPDFDVQGALDAGLRPFWVRTGAMSDAKNVKGTHLERLLSLRDYMY